VPLAVALLFILPLALGDSESGSAGTLAADGAVRPADMPLPPIEGPTLHGGSFAPGSLRGKVVVMNVWNPDCPPCVQEAPALAAAWHALRGRPDVAMLGLMFVGRGWPDDRASARRLAAANGLSYPTVVDGDSRIVDALALPGIPVTIVADASGRVRFTIVGRAQPGQIQMLASQLVQAGRIADLIRRLPA
jgi:thiol-disulfide isomerase/thioredoxin